MSETPPSVINTGPKSGNIHRILAHSYTLYFFALLAGLLLDFIFPLRLFKNPLMVYVGIGLIIISTLLVLWAQKTSRILDKEKEVSKENFCRGPYCYTRSPTHWGLSLMVLGFGILANATFVVIATVIAFFITKSVFLRREEKILSQKYGAPYDEYKKSVKL